LPPGGGGTQDGAADDGAGEDGMGVAAVDELGPIVVLLRHEVVNGRRRSKAPAITHTDRATVKTLATSSALVDLR